MTTYFLLGIVTLAALFYIFNVPLGTGAGPEKTRLNYLQERKEVIYENMRDLNFEYRAGKLSDEDYNSLKASMEEEAALNEPLTVKKSTALTLKTFTLLLLGVFIMNCLLALILCGLIAWAIGLFSSPVDARAPHTRAARVAEVGSPPEYPLIARRFPH